MIYISEIAFFTCRQKPSSTFTGSETAANPNAGNATSVTMTAQWRANCTENCTDLDLNVNESMGYSYTGAIQGITLKKAGYYEFEVWGAQGGGNGGPGGYSLGVVSYPSNNSVIYIFIGEAGKNKTTPSTNNTYIDGGINGGGKGGTSGSTSASAMSASGGGATHISTINCGELKNCSSYMGTYNSSNGTYDGGKILIVAGGGGGAGSWSNTNYYGGNGGGYQGGRGTSYSASDSAGYGGTQNSGGTQGSCGSSYTITPGSFGLGGNGETSGSGHLGGGGGGGWYGGGGGGGGNSGGGGGSGYIGNSLLLSAKNITKQMYMYNGNAGGCTASTAALTKTTCTTSTGAHVANAANTGNGYAKITYLGT